MLHTIEGMASLLAAAVAADAACLTVSRTLVDFFLHHVRHLLGWDMLLLFPGVRNNFTNVLLAVN